MSDEQTQPAKLPVFRNKQVERAYQAGEFQSRLEADLADIFTEQENGEDVVITLNREDALARLSQLNSLALIQNGEVLPILDIEQMRRPTSLTERIQLYQSAARTLLDAVQAIVEDKEQRDNDDEGGCYATR